MDDKLHHCALFPRVPDAKKPNVFQWEERFTMPHGYNFAALLLRAGVESNMHTRTVMVGKKFVDTSYMVLRAHLKSRRFLNAKTRARRTHCAKRGSSRRTTPCVKRRLQRQLHTLKLTMESVS